VDAPAPQLRRSERQRQKSANVADVARDAGLPTGINFLDLMEEGGVVNEAYLDGVNEYFQLDDERSVMFVGVEGSDAEVFAVYIPKGYRDALDCPDSPQWVTAINKILTQLEDNKFAHFVKRTPGMNVIPSRYVFAYKDPVEKGGEGTYKVRLVLDGSKQEYGVDYMDSWAPSLPSAGWRLFLHICAVEDLELASVDVKNAYIQVPMSTGGSYKIHIRAPQGMEVPQGLVLELDRALEGSKQAGHLWYKYLRGVLEEFGFAPLNTAETIYVRGNLAEGTFQMLAIHVDDIQIASQSKALEEQFVKEIQTKFQIKRGSDGKFVGLDLSRDREARTIKVTCETKIAQLLERHGLENAHKKFTPCAPGVQMSRDSTSEKADIDEYQKLVGGLQFIREFRADTAFAVGRLSRYLSCPNKDHQEAAEYLAGYLRRTADMGMVFGGRGGNPYEIRIVTDSDHGMCPDTARSTSGVSVYIGHSLIIHKSKLQHLVTLSSAEAELVALILAVCEAKWVRGMLTALTRRRPHMTAYTDSMAVVQMANQQQHLQRTRHLNIKRHFLKDEVAEGRLSVRHVRGKENTADIFTKPLARVHFERLREALGIR
jgi:hypothetical protein